MNHSILPRLFFCWVFLLIGCSDEAEVVLKADSSYIPFPRLAVTELSKENKQLLKRKDFVRIDPGEFIMGSPGDESGHQSNETAHKVRISKPYYVGVHEVSIDEWNQHQTKALMIDMPFSLPDDMKAIMRRLAKEVESTNAKNDRILIPDPGEATYTIGTLEKIIPVIQRLLQAVRKKKDKVSWPVVNIESALTKTRKYLLEKKLLPVTYVSYTQAKAFCWKKTERAWKEKSIPKTMIYRLPTEAEWEYACRGGLPGICGLEDGDRLSGMNANINGSRKEFIIGDEPYLLFKAKLVPANISKVKYPANSFGIHDMHGSVYEWCHDFYGEYASSNLAVDPTGPIRGHKRVLRGGSFLRTAYECRSAARRELEPSWRGSETGFRMVIGYPL